MDGFLLYVSFFLYFIGGLYLGLLIFGSEVTEAKRDKYRKLIKELRAKIHYWIGQKKYWYNAYCIVLDEALDLHRNIEAAELKIKELNTKNQEQGEYIVRLCDVVDLYRSRIEDVEALGQEAAEILNHAEIK